MENGPTKSAVSTSTHMLEGGCDQNAEEADLTSTREMIESMEMSKSLDPARDLDESLNPAMDLDESLELSEPDKPDLSTLPEAECVKCCQLTMVRNGHPQSEHQHEDKGDVKYCNVPESINYFSFNQMLDMDFFKSSSLVGDGGLKSAINLPQAGKALLQTIYLQPLRNLKILTGAKKDFYTCEVLYKFFYTSYVHIYNNTIGTLLMAPLHLSEDSSIGCNSLNI